MSIFEITLFGIRIAPTYYGAAYAVGFLLGYWIVKKRGVVPSEKIDDLLLWVFLWVFLGGRLGYVLFYNLPYYLSNPTEILMPWKGGMSFHWGVIGVLMGMWAYSIQKKESFLRTADEVVLILPIGIGLGRIANYLNGELFGFSPYSGPLAMMVQWIPHFPSPLLEAFLEGPLLALILVAALRLRLPPGGLGTVFLMSYALLRIFAEFFRLPDAQIGYLLFGSTLGQILSMIMLISGIGIFWLLQQRNSPKKPSISKV